MSLADRIDQKLAALVDAANDALPDGVTLGYAIPAVDKEDGTLESDAEIIRVGNEILFNYRRALTRLAERGHTWASEDMAEVETDAATLGQVRVVFDLRDRETGIAVVRSYALSTLVNLWRDDTKTNEEKRQIVRNQIVSFYQDLQARLL